DWMLEPFQNRGREWVIEPLRSGKQELNWAGEYAGKWLDAATRVAAGAQDARLKQQAAEFAASLIATQDTDGYLGIEMPEKRGVADWDLWNVKYALTGLLTDYELNQTPASLQAAIRGGEWLIHHFAVVDQMRASHEAVLTHAYMLTSYLGGLVKWTDEAGRRDELEWVERVW